MIHFRGGINLKEFGGIGNVLNAGCNLTFLLKDKFLTAASAPLATPRTCEPGPGTLTLVQNDGQFSVSGEALQIPAQGTPAWGDLSFYDAASPRSRLAGLAELFNCNPSSGSGQIGFDTNTSSTNADNTFYVNGANLLVLPGNVNIGATTLLQNANAVTSLRNLGAYFFLGNELVWIENTANSTSVYPRLTTFDLAATLDTFRLASLADNDTCPCPPLGVRDLDLSVPGTGNGTSSIAAPAAGNTFVHTADFVLRFPLDTLPSAGSVDLGFRRVDTNNLWTVRCHSNTNFYLNETVDASASNRGFAAGVLAGGEVITLVVNGPTITGYVDDALAWSYTSSGNFITETGGYVISLGTGGVISNLTARTLDGIANVTSTNFPGYGIATDLLPGPRAAADTFTHETRASFEFWLVSLPSGASLRVNFRKANATDYFEIVASAAGDLALYRYPGVVGLTNAGGLVGDERIVVFIDGDTITAYADTTLMWTYNGATQYQTAIAGEIKTIAAGSAISDLIARPLDLAAAPNTPGADLVSTTLTRLAQ